MQKLRNIVAYVMEFAGVASICYGMYQLGFPALYIGCGLFLFVAAQFIGAKR